MRAGDRTALDVGTAVHKALEAFYFGADVDSMEKSFLESLDLANVSEDERIHGLRMVRSYHQRFDEERSGWEVLCQEESVEVHLPESDVLLVGRPDCVARIKGKVWHVQHKTVAANSSIPMYVKRYDLAPHEPAYKLALRESKGIEIEGTLLNLLIKTKVPRYERYYVPIGEDRIAQMREMVGQVARLMALPIRVMNTGSCLKWNRLCQYHDLCLGLPPFPDLWEKRKADYVDERQSKVREEEQSVSVAVEP